MNDRRTRKARARRATASKRGEPPSPASWVLPSEDERKRIASLVALNGRHALWCRLAVPTETGCTCWRLPRCSGCGVIVGQSCKVDCVARPALWPWMLVAEALELGLISSIEPGSTEDPPTGAPIWA